MLQDHRRPLWPIGVMMSPLVVGMMVCAITRSDAIMPVLYAYFLLLGIGLIIYMVRATRQYGRWLRDNYADLEHKEVWQSLVVLAIIMMTFSLYAYEHLGLFFKYAARINTILLTGFLVWRAETLSDLSQFDSKSVSTSVPSETIDDDLSSAVQDKIGLLLQQHCVDTQLYLQHDLTILQLAKAIGTNRFYLSQYFSSRGLHYNDYINELRIQHFVNLYRESIADKRDFTVQQLAQECGYRSYSTFSRVFKQQMGKNVTTWIGDIGE
jgi:AraC-like DNA-binding protein